LWKVAVLPAVLVWFAPSVRKAIGKTKQYIGRAGTTAKNFASKNKAALIASGALGAAGLAGGYAAGRKKSAKADD